MQPEPQPVCPLCGGPNGCVPARDGCFGTPCWCRSQTFDPTVLAKLATLPSGKSCICASCAGLAEKSPPALP
ncbi:cysteine-rich CWC family protein [Chitinimonas arctica]|uniref:Cysteine-rich CWC family protein n=1 Tax=Chitinimonas arctica TaxID=2594795 RepID=A0A516SHF3_9NEIS|nr:cysteine-rich CWC family protein [Chitinimonas arctica]